MKMFNVNRVRSDFPVLSRMVHGKALVYLDNAATSQKPRSVIRALSEYYEGYNANIHRAVHTLGQEATEKYEAARCRIGRLINAKIPEHLILTRGTTESINLVSHSWAKQHIKPGDEILTTQMEHHSNLVPWQRVCEEQGAVLKFIPLASDGTLDISGLNALLTERTKLVALTHASNVLGTINPIKEIVAEAHQVNALVLVDGAQSVPHHSVDVAKLGCDFFAFSGHRMLGPTGVGALYAKAELLEEMDPFMGGGEMIREVSMEKSTWNDIPWKFEDGTPNIAQVIGLGAAIDYLNKIGMQTIADYEKELLSYAKEKLQNIPELSIYGNTKEKGAVISFNIGKIHPHDVAHILDTSGIAIRAGHHCAQPIMKRLKVSATNRASFYIYNTSADIDSLIDGLTKTVDLFT